MTSVTARSATGDPRSLRTTTVRSLGTRAAAWDALVRAAAVPSPFLLSWWLEALRDERRSRFVLVLDDDELLGGLPVTMDRWALVRRVRLLGDGPLAPDHLDLVAQPGHNEEVVEAIARWLRRQQPCLVDFSGIVDRALVLDALPSVRLLTVVSSAPYLPLADVAGTVTPIRHRRDHRQQARRIEREGAEYRIVGGDGEQLHRALDALRLRHVERWGTGSGLARMFPTFARAALAGAATGAVRIHQLEAGGVVVATEISLDAGDRRCRYQIGRSTEHRWRGAGNVLLGEAILSAQRDGCAEFDFLRGPEPFKFDWTTYERPVLRARVALGSVPRSLLLAQRVAERGRPPARRVKAAIRRWRARTRRGSG
jgi:CelD/BcsL family acetyltransferase involved in cellulose biosynthesis